MRREPPVLVGLPFDAASTFLRGAAEAPPRIREALHSPASNLWTETGIRSFLDRKLGPTAWFRPESAP